jgi:uncharacterized protein (DUF2062 family)
MPRRWLKRVLPDIDKYRDSAVARLLGPRFFHPALWHLNRRSVAGAVAIGMFCGLIPGPLQMLGGAIGAVMFRRNLPVALVTTLYTNPVTIVPLYVIAWQVGALVLGGGQTMPPPPDLSMASMADWGRVLLEWTTALGSPLLVGVPALALLLAGVGYVVVHVGWGLYLRHVWRQRARRRRN